jgi:hypothetical protein
MPKNREETGFLAGAALAALHPLACHEHPIGRHIERVARLVG